MKIFELDSVADVICVASTQIAGAHIILAGVGSRVKAFNAATAQPLVNEAVFSGTRVHGIKPQPRTLRASHAPEPRGGGAALRHTSQLLALHGGCEICIAQLRSDEQAPTDDLGRTGCVEPSLRLENLRRWQPGRHWILALAWAGNATRSPRTHGVGPAQTSPSNRTSGGVAEAAATVVAGLMDNSFEVWHICTAPGAPWRPVRAARIECAQRQLLYCMDLSVDIQHGGVDFEGAPTQLIVHAASGAAASSVMQAA